MILSYNHVNFNSAWVVSQSLEDFIKHEKHHGLSKEELTEAYKMAKAQVKDAKKEGETPVMATTLDTIQTEAGATL